MESEVERAPITEFHKYELLDRIHCVAHMFDELIYDHPAADLIRDKIVAASDTLHAAYQAAGVMRFEGCEGELHLEISTDGQELP